MSAKWMLAILALGFSLTRLDGELIASRFYYHFVGNNVFDPAREPVVVPELPYMLSPADLKEVLQMVDAKGRVHSTTAGADIPRFLQRLPKFVKQLVLGGTVDGTVAYATFVQKDNPEGAAAMLRVRDRVLSSLNNASLGLPTLYPVDERAPWAAFSVTSNPSVKGSFQWHYDAESPNEYRALYVAQGGDDCGVAAVKYQTREGVFELPVRTGMGYLIRGSTTFHAVKGGGCPGTAEAPWIRHLIGFQFTTVPGRRPMPLCALLLQIQSWSYELRSYVTSGLRLM